MQWIKTLNFLCKNDATRLQHSKLESPVAQALMRWKLLLLNQMKAGIRIQLSWKRICNIIDWQQMKFGKSLEMQSN